MSRRAAEQIRNQLLAVCLVVLLLPTSAMADTCLSQPQLAGVIFGSVGATLAICVVVAIIFWAFMRRSDKSDKISDKSSVQKDVNDIESKTYDCIPQKDSYKDQTMMETLKLPPRKVLDTGTQKSYSVENVNEVKSNVGVLLKTDNSTGFGMKIQGSMNEGIYVKAIVPMGAADQTGNILPGDRIKSLTINFDNMVYEDALTLLSYASPYKVKFELERKVETPPPMDGDPSGARIHPLFRSNTLTHIQFNPVSSNRSSQSSIETTIKADDLPKIKEQPPPPPKIETPPPPPKVELPPPPPKIEEKKEEEKKEELKVERPAEKVEEVKLCEPPSADLSAEVVPSAVISEFADSTTIDTDLSKMESSDYASDNTSEYRESDHEGGGNSAPPEPVEPPPIIQTSVVERVENADLSVKTEVTTTTKPAPHKPEYCKTLPPKAKPAVTRSPSPRLNKPLTKAPSPAPSIKAGLRKSREDCSKPSQITVPTKRNLSNGRTAITPTRHTEVSTGPPEIVEARVSRIPKRTDSVKTPIIERKLPPLPKSLTHRSHSAEDKSDVWSRLYTDKRNQLRRTRDTVDPMTKSTTMEAEITSTIPSPQLSPKQIRQPTEFRFGNLDVAHRERLAANQDILDRQTEELRQLGVL